jgi:parallel beta-helix repeat protein
VIDGYVTTSLTSPIPNGAPNSTVTFTVTNGSVLKPGFGVTVEDGTEPTSQEALYITAIHGNTVTAIHGLNGTVPRSTPSGRLLVVGGDNLTITGAGAIYRDFEVTTSDPVRSATVYDAQSSPHYQGQCIRHDSPTKLINLVLHNCGGGGYFGTPRVTGGEVYGVVAYNTGYKGGPQYAGHGFYVQSNAAPTLLTNNIVANNFAIGIKAVSQNGNTIGFRINGNVTWNNGAHDVAHPELRTPGIEVGANNGIADDNVVSGNYTYQPNGTIGNGIKLGYAGTNGKAVVTNNLIMGNTYSLAVSLWSNLTVTGNTMLAGSNIPCCSNKEVVSYLALPGTTPIWNNNSYINLNSVTNPFGLAGVADLTFANWKQQTGFDSNSTYSTNRPPDKVVIQKNIYEAGRATVIVFNWSRSANVSLDLSQAGLVNGQRYKLVNPLDYANSIVNPVLSGVYNSASPNVTLNATSPLATAVATPVGFSYKPATTLPEFGVFLIIPY